MIKREINLRTREFAISREFYWPRVFTILGIFFLMALLAGGSFLVHLHQLNLESEVMSLETEKSRLEARVAPIEQMEAEIRELKVRFTVDSSFSDRYIPWSSYLGQIVQVADEGGISIASINCPDAVRINMRGTGLSMRHIVLFVENLDSQDFLRNTAYTVMTLQQGEFSFDINTRIIAGGSD